MGNDDHSLSRGNGDLIIFTEPSGMIEPREGALNNPAPRKFLPLVRFDLLRNINAETKLLFCIRNKSTSISSVCTDLLDRWAAFISPFCGGYPTLCVMNISGMNHNRQQTAQHIHYDVPLSAFRFFPPSIPRSSLAATVFTLWESMIA